MAQLSDRLTGLSPERRRLLAALLERSRAPETRAETLVHVEGAEGAGAGDKEECRRFYDGINRSLDESPVGPFSLFLNLGYLPDASPSCSVVALPEHWINKHSARLVLEVIGRCELKGRRVLDVGCGRGGAVSLIAQFFEAASICGVDLSPAAIAFCRTQHRQRHVRFEVGDAERLRYVDQAFDVVLNVESSSTYPDVFAFFRQVFRLLAAGGDFLYTDALPAARSTECTAALRGMGLTLEADRDITANVLLACDDVARRRVEAFGAGAASGLDHFLGVPGSQYYDAMKRGDWTYRIQHWKKVAD